MTKKKTRRKLLRSNPNIRTKKEKKQTTNQERKISGIKLIKLMMMKIKEEEREQKEAKEVLKEEEEDKDQCLIKMNLITINQDSTEEEMILK